MRPTFCLIIMALGPALPPMAGAENPIVPEGADLELLHTRQAKLNSGLAEGPAPSPKGGIDFTDMPFGEDRA